jgi:hypothetical protein
MGSPTVRTLAFVVLGVLLLTSSCATVFAMEMIPIDVTS